MREMIDRRTLIGGTVALGAGLAAAGRAVAAPAEEIIPLWPQGTPGGQAPRVAETTVVRSPAPNDIAYLHVARPRLIRHAPSAAPNGATLLLLPGGGYQRVVVGKEGYSIAAAFGAMGYECYSLLYRLPADGWSAGPEAPLQDAQRALRLIRQRVGPQRADRVGVIGFSAGGHLAARLIARQDLATYTPVDAADRLALAPRVAALLYPVVLMDGPFVHGGSRKELLGSGSAADRLRAFSADSTIAAGTPPTFIAHAIDDKVVPLENGLAMLAALRRASVATEAHFPETGGHGFGLTIPNRRFSWPETFADWAGTHGLT